MGTIRLGRPSCRGKEATGNVGDVSEGKDTQTYLAVNFRSLCVPAMRAVVLAARQEQVGILLAPR